MSSLTSRLEPAYGDLRRGQLSWYRNEMVAHSFSPEPQSLALSDGRTLAYASFGADPRASTATAAPVTTTVFYFHGFPASRLEAALWHAAALRLNVQLIAADRPGVGLSTFQPARTLLDWPSDVLALADHLHVERFGVLGASGGAPYVLACAKSLPEARLRAAAVVSGLYPVALGTGGMLWEGRMLLWVASRMAPAVALLLDASLGKAARNSSKPHVFDEIVMRDMRKRPGVDRKCVEDDEGFRRRFLASVRESFHMGSQGVAWDAKLLGAPWGFGLEEIEIMKLTLWHGGLDQNSPIGMARRAAEILRGARFQEFEGEGHVSLIVNHMEEILRSLAADAR